MACADWGLFTFKQLWGGLNLVKWWAVTTFHKDQYTYISSFPCFHGHFQKYTKTCIICLKNCIATHHQLIGVSIPKRTTSQMNSSRSISFARLLAERKRLPLDQVVAKAFGWEPLTKALVNLMVQRGWHPTQLYYGISKYYWDNIAILIRSQIPMNQSVECNVEPRVFVAVADLWYALVDVDGAYRSNDWQTQKNGVVLNPKLTASQTSWCIYTRINITIWLLL